jgi:membrane associated rhomboid family serine protease
MTPWVRRLIIANIAVFILSYTLPPELVDRFAFRPDLLLSRPWSPITYMFLHAGLGHIFFNMLALLVFGPGVEARIGGERFLRLYFFSGLMGALLSLFAPSVPIVGASGAIFGVQLAYAMFWPRNRIFIYGVIPVEAWLLVLIMTGLSLFGAGGYGSQGVAHLAHLGGFAGGYLYIKWLERTAGIAKFRRASTPLGSPRVSASGLDRWTKIPRESLHEVNRDEYDRIMEKIRTAGVGSLTPGDREFLERFSAR